jgi:hypothetical protein
MFNKIAKTTKTNGYVVYLPDNYDASKKWPVQFFFHGDGQIGDGSEAGLQSIIDLIDSPYYPWAAQLKKDRCIMIAPQLNPQPYNIYWPLSYADEALEFAKQYSIDTNRLYLSGISRGGDIVFGYPASSVDNGSKFAAILACCCVSVGGNYSFVKSPVMAYHAKNDPIVSYLGTDSTIKMINAANPPVKAIAKFFDIGGHEIWGLVFGNNEAWDWMLGQTKGSTPVPINPPVPTSTLKADASATQTTVAGTTAVLDGTKSVGYKKGVPWDYMSWAVLSGSGQTWTVFPNGNKIGEKLTVQNLVPGNYVFEETVKDENGNISTDRVAMTVSAVLGKKIIAEVTIAGKVITIFDDNTWAYK